MLTFLHVPTLNAQCRLDWNSSGCYVSSINALNNIGLVCNSLSPLIWYDLNYLHAHQVPLEHMLLVYEAMNDVLIIIIRWNILLRLYMLMPSLSGVNLVRFRVTVSFGLLLYRWWTAERPRLVQAVLVGCDAGAVYGEKSSWKWRGGRGLWLPDLDMLSLFILFHWFVAVGWLGTS
jgi:hypothetical protein